MSSHARAGRAYHREKTVGLPYLIIQERLYERGRCACGTTRLALIRADGVEGVDGA